MAGKIADTADDWGAQHWSAAHADGYNKTVYSITPDQGVRDRTVQEIRDVLAQIPSEIPCILLPACGTETILENDIAANIKPSPFVLCTDFQAVADMARAKHLANNPLVSVAYQGRDSRDLGFQGIFDAVVVMNSVVAPSDTDNRQMLKSFHEALVPGGALIGLFPTIFCALDMSLTITKPGIKSMLASVIDLDKKAVIDPSHNAQQVFYTPLQLREILIQAGFGPENIKMDIYFMDSPYFQEESRRHYGLEAEDPPIYELFVVARKGKGAAPAP